MKKYYIMAGTALAVLACTNGQAQTLDTTTGVTTNVSVQSDTSQLPPLPVRIDADKMYYNDTTGAVWATGSVEVSKGNQQLQSPRIEGNTKEQTYKSVGEYHFLEEKGTLKDLKGTGIIYNANTGAAHTEDVFGYADPFWVKAKVADFDGKTGHIEKGWLTTKHAIAFKGAPDYRVEGDSIDVYPEDKAIIHNARFYVKNTKILSMKSYKVSLRHDRRGQISIFSLLPRPKYNSTDGISLEGSIAYPVGSRGEVFLDYTWGSNIGFKPSFGYIHDLPWGTARLEYSRDSATLDARTVWVEKKPEFSIDTKTYQVGKTPFTVRGGLSYGRWYEGDIRGTHSKYYGELSHRPIPVGTHSEVTAYGGYQRDYYGYNSLVRTMPYWGIGVTTKVSPTVKVWAGYRQNNVSELADSPYPFDQVDVKYNLYYGFSVQATKLDRFSIQLQRDLQTHDLRYVDLTWHRDLHSFEGTLTYRVKQKKWEYTLVAKDF